MNKDEFENLQNGDIVQNKGTGQGYFIIGTYDGHAIAARAIDITNPSEWEIIQKHSGIAGEAVVSNAKTLIAKKEILSEPYDVRQRMKELEHELEVTDKLLDQRNEVMNAIPECPIHGKQCVPHAISWVNAMKDLQRQILIFGIQKINH
jgi:hypothetical protein